MKKLPEHIEAQLNRLIDEGMPAEKIAFVMRLSKKVVEAAIAERHNNTTRPAAVSR